VGKKNFSWGRTLLELPLKPFKAGLKPVFPKNVLGKNLPKTLGTQSYKHKTPVEQTPIPRLWKKTWKSLKEELS